MDFAILAKAFALTLPVELPDKTLVATLLLSTRFRAVPVFIGVVAAFAVQCVVAAGFGSAMTLLPEKLTATVIIVLFAVGAVALLREGFASTAGSVDHAPAEPRRIVTPLRAALTSFGVLFAAEWGDASQLATAAMTARYEAPISVGLGSFIALVVVAGLAILIGARLKDRMPTKWLQRVAGIVFGCLAVGTAVAMFL
ncbi:TMEM165/GDT1 family protein [Pseudonocardiaceae bacterium YIM PH 21723]|nr:TMEM165/GDT1 family protein [Pseudonocardiaceae bacterium YIM PH 21723]